MRRVVVTGLGLLTSIGANVNETWQNLLSCKTGIKKITNFETSDLPCKIAGFIEHDSKLNNFFDSQSIIGTKELKRNDRFIIYGLIAASEAIEDSGINTFNEEQKYNTGVSVRRWYWRFRNNL